jgi:hypothetical protein
MHAVPHAHHDIACDVNIACCRTGFAVKGSHGVALNQNTVRANTSGSGWECTLPGHRYAAAGQDEA